jgi:mercuric ion transport protein
VLTENSLSQSASQAPRIAANADRGVATLGTMASIGALFSAAACCILPLALAALGVGSAGLSSVVPFHWPLTIAAIVVVAAGWLFYLLKRQACVRDASCTTTPPAKSTFILLVVASVFVAISACWDFIEAPLMRALGGA